MKKSRKNISKKFTKKKMRGGSTDVATDVAIKFKNLSDLDLTYTGHTSIGSAKKQSQRDVAMNENMKLIYDLLLEVYQKNQAVAKKIMQVNNNLTQIQTQFKPTETDLPLNYNELENQNVFNLLIAIVNGLKSKIQKA